MIEETVFTEDTIRTVVYEKYKINVFSVKKLERGSANIYLLNDNAFILKEFQSKYTVDEINKEIIVINHLKKDNIKVPVYVKTVDEQYSFIYKGKVVILQEYIEGYVIESNLGSAEQIIESAQVLGKIVESLEKLDYKLPHSDVSSWYSNEKLDKSMKKHKLLLEKVNGELKGRITKDLNDKIEMLDFIKKNIVFDNMKHLTYKNTHGDYSVMQFIYKNDKINAVIDFAAACNMPIVWEVIRSYSYIDPLAKDGNLDVENLIKYTKEFNKYIKLNKYDIQYMPYLYLLQLLNSDYGYKQYLNDNTKKELLEFAFFRTNLCRYLFENATIIENKLKENIWCDE